MHLKPIQTSGLSAGIQRLNTFPATVARFGCRMVAVMSEAPKSPQSESLRLDLLSRSDNSLLHQSKPGRKVNDGIHSPRILNDLSEIFKNLGNPHGWGMVAYIKKAVTPWRYLSALPAHIDLGYRKATHHFAQAGPEVLMAHTRLVSEQCKTVRLENVHPFVHDNWSFMHNGYVGGAFLKNPVKDHYKRYLETLPVKPKGDTDSEKAFFYFLGKLQEKYGKAGHIRDSHELGIGKVRRTFAEALHELVVNTPRIPLKLKDDAMGAQGNIEMAPRCNFIATDGNVMFAYRLGTKLFLGIKTMPSGQRDLILASEPIQPKESLVGGWMQRRVRAIRQLGGHPVPLAKQGILWQEVPEDSLLTVRKDSVGKIQYDYQPLHQAAFGKPEHYPA